MNPRKRIEELEAELAGAHELLRKEREAVRSYITIHAHHEAIEIAVKAWRERAETAEAQWGAINDDANGAEAACAAMREALQALQAMWLRAGRDRRKLIRDALAADAGRGWLSPERAALIRVLAWDTFQRTGSSFAEEIHGLVQPPEKRG